MSVSVSVCRPHLSAPIDLGAAPDVEMDAWLDGERALVVFEAAVASGALFSRHFAGVASSLGLPLLARADELGLRLSDPGDLTRFLWEVDLVEAAWHDRGLPGQWAGELHGPGRWTRLLEGAASLRHAARLALDGQLHLHLG